MKKDASQEIRSRCDEADGVMTKIHETQLVNEGLFDLNSNRIVDGDDVKAKMAEKYGTEKTSV